LIYEPIENHHGEGGNILFVDGHVEFYSKQGYDKILAPYKDRAIKVQIEGE
jgi:prepilin-type processing-associated H-X9-DG protein